MLRRPRLRKYGIEERDVREVLLLLSPLLPEVEVEVGPIIRDPDDAPVVEAALSGGADAIVSGDRDLLDDLELVAWLGERGIEVLTPSRVAERLREP